MPRLLVCRALEPLLGPVLPLGPDADWFEESAPLAGPEVEAVVDLPPRRWDPAAFDRVPNLRVLAACSAGVDHVDLAGASDRNVVVTNTPNVLSEAVADLTWGLILAAARGIPTHERTVREGRWDRFSITRFLGKELRGATLGIVGAGRIGQAVAHRAPAFGMNVMYANPSRRPDLEAATGATHAALEDVLAESDVVSLHAPLTPRTRGMMDRKRFARMREGSVFVNTSRGELVDEDALGDALTRGHLAGAGVDVFVGEPRLSQVLAGAPNLVVTPHMGSATYDTRSAMARLALANARAVLEGRPPPTRVAPPTAPPPAAGPAPS